MIEKKDIIGAPYPNWKLGKVHDYPSVVFMFFRTKRLKNSMNHFILSTINGKNKEQYF